MAAFRAILSWEYAPFTVIGLTSEEIYLGLGSQSGQKCVVCVVTFFLWHGGVRA